MKSMIKDVAAVMGYVAVMGLVGCITAAGFMGCTKRDSQTLPQSVQAADFWAEVPVNAADGNT